jgi:hypothetical protein
MDEQNGRKAYKEEEYEMYAYWKFLPVQLRGLPEESIKKLGIDDEDVLFLLAIKTQRQFAAEFGIKDLGTLTDWNKRLMKENSLPYIRFWSKFLDGNVVFAHYKKILQDPKSQDITSWFSLHENF